MLTASTDKTVRIWDTETHQQIGLLAGHGEAVFSAAFSPDSRHVLTASSDLRRECGTPSRISRSLSSSRTMIR